MKRLQILFFLFIAGTTLALQPYYSDVDLTKRGIELREELADKIIRTHVNFLSYTPGIWEALKIIDADPKNPNNILLIYGYEDRTDQNPDNDRTRDKNQNGGGNGNWNREHIYPKSLGKPNLGTEGPGADAHQLGASDVKRNAKRANRKFAAGSGNSGTVGTNWYPGDEWKGDVARILMYMYLHYGDRCLPSNVAVGEANAIDTDMIDLLLQWNAEDPVSSLEDQRNTYLSSDAKYAQGNRNPFIDEPYLATAIWGGPKAEDRWGIYSGRKSDQIELKIASGSKDLVEIKTLEKIEQITVYDIKGRLIERFKKRSKINTEFYSVGVYFLAFKTKKGLNFVEIKVK